MLPPLRFRGLRNGAPVHHVKRQHLFKAVGGLCQRLFLVLALSMGLREVATLDDVSAFLGRPQPCRIYQFPALRSSNCFHHHRAVPPRLALSPAAQSRRELMPRSLSIPFNVPIFKSRPCASGST